MIVWRKDEKVDNKALRLGWHSNARMLRHGGESGSHDVGCGNMFSDRKTVCKHRLGISFKMVLRMAHPLTSQMASSHALSITAFKLFKASTFV